MRVTVEESHEGKMIGGQIIRRVRKKEGEITENSVRAQTREREREKRSINYQIDTAAVANV